MTVAVKPFLSALSMASTAPFQVRYFRCAIPEIVGLHVAVYKERKKNALK